MTGCASGSGTQRNNQDGVCPFAHVPSVNRNDNHGSRIFIRRISREFDKPNFTTTGLSHLVALPIPPDQKVPIHQRPPMLRFPQVRRVAGSHNKHEFGLPISLALPDLCAPESLLRPLLTATLLSFCADRIRDRQPHRATRRMSCGICSVYSSYHCMTIV